MVTDAIPGNVFETPYKHIAFAVNTEGHNDAGFAGQVSSKIPSFANTGGNELGDILEGFVEGKNFYGLVCHSFGGDGWENAPNAITACLDKLNVPEDETIAVVLMGAGMIGQLSGANVKENIRAIHRSKKKCVIYNLMYTKKAVMNEIG